MNFDDIKEDLEDFEVYKNKLLLINETEAYNLFYVIIYNGKIHKFNNTKLKSKRIRDEFIDGKKYINLNDYVKKELHNKYIKENLYKKDFQIITYIIPENHRTKNDFNKMNNLVFKFDKFSFEIINKPINKFFKQVNQRNIALLGAIYTIYMLIGLSSVGIPFYLVNSIENLGAFIVFFISILLLSFTIIIPFIFLYIFTDKFFFISLIMVIILIYIYLIKKYYIITEFHNYSRIQIYNLFTLFFKIIPLITLSVILSLPFVHMFELILSKDNKYNLQPTLLINLYKDFYGYPNIIEVKDKKYILVGKDDTTYQVYDLNKTVNYYYKNKQDSNSTKKLCINIEDIVHQKNREDDIALKLLMLSPNNHIDNDLNYLKINDTNITKKYAYNAKNIDLNITLLKNNCK